MSPGNAAQNLVFGILALLNDFIDRHAPIDAFNRRVEDISRPLGRPGRIPPEPDGA